MVPDFPPPSVQKEVRLHCSYDMGSALTHKTVFYFDCVEALLFQSLKKISRSGHTDSQLFYELGKAHIVMVNSYARVRKNVSKTQILRKKIS